MMTVKVWLKTESIEMVFNAVNNTSVEGPFYRIGTKDDSIRDLIPIADIYRINEVDDDCDDDE